MHQFSSVARAFLLIGLTFACSSAQAAVVSWHIVSSASTVALVIPNGTLTLTSTGGITGSAATSATLTLRVLNPGTGTTATPTGWTIGNKQYLQGSLNSITDFSSSIQFLAPSVIDGIDSGSYQPLADGNAGTAPADFGMHVFGGFSTILGTFNTDVAIRQVLSLLTGGAIPIDGLGQFPTDSGLQFGIESADVAHRTRNIGGIFGNFLGQTIGSGAATLASQVTGNNGTPGTILGDPGNGILIIPINVPIQIPFGADGQFMLNGTLSGSIYAVCMPEPSTYALLAIGLVTLGPGLLRRRLSARHRRSGPGASADADPPGDT